MLEFFRSTGGKLVIAFVILVAAVSSYFAIKPEKPVTGPAYLGQVWGACSECGYYQLTTFENLPAQCPRCKKTSFWRAYQCENGHVVPTGKETGVQWEMQCQVCGTKRIHRLPPDTKLPDPPAMK